MSLHQHLLCLVAPPLPALVPADPNALPVTGILWHTPPRQYPATLYAFHIRSAPASLGLTPWTRWRTFRLVISLLTEGFSASLPSPPAVTFRTPVYHSGPRRTRMR